MKLSELLPHMVAPQHFAAVTAVLDTPLHVPVAAGNQVPADTDENGYFSLDQPGIMDVVSDVEEMVVRVKAGTAAVLEQQVGFVGFARDLVGPAPQGAPHGAVSLQDAVRSRLGAAIVFDTWQNLLVARGRLRDELIGARNQGGLLSELYPFVALDGRLAERGVEYPFVALVPGG